MKRTDTARLAFASFLLITLSALIAGCGGGGGGSSSDDSAGANPGSGSGSGAGGSTPIVNPATPSEGYVALGELTHAYTLQRAADGVYQAVAVDVDGIASVVSHEPAAGLTGSAGEPAGAVALAASADNQRLAYLWRVPGDDDDVVQELIVSDLVNGTREAATLGITAERGGVGEFIWNPSTTRSGLLAYVANDKTQTNDAPAYLYDTSANTRTLISSQARHAQLLSWSPDGRYLAVVAGANPEENNFTTPDDEVIQVFVYDASTDAIAQASSTGQLARGLRWSDDGAYFAFGIGPKLVPPYAGRLEVRRARDAALVHKDSSISAHAITWHWAPGTTDIVYATESGAGDSAVIAHDAAAGAQINRIEGFAIDIGLGAAGLIRAIGSNLDGSSDNRSRLFSGNYKDPALVRQTGEIDPNAQVLLSPDDSRALAYNKETLVIQQGTSRTVKIVPGLGSADTGLLECTWSDNSAGALCEVSSGFGGSAVITRYVLDVVSNTLVSVGVSTQGEFLTADRIAVLAADGSMAPGQLRVHDLSGNATGGALDAGAPFGRGLFCGRPGGSVIAGKAKLKAPPAPQAPQLRLTWCAASLGL